MPRSTEILSPEGPSRLQHHINEIVSLMSAIATVDVIPSNRWHWYAIPPLISFLMPP